jgi:hypothetical protein
MKVSGGIADGQLEGGGDILPEELSGKRRATFGRGH